MTTDANVLKTITRAIVEKRCVAIRRVGQARLIAIEPHALYTDANHDIILDFFQPPITDRDPKNKGTWDSIVWRRITAAFWMNTAFEPRTKRGFNPGLEKYQSGSLAIVDTDSRPNKDRRIWQQIETSIEQHLARHPGIEPNR